MFYVGKGCGNRYKSQTTRSKSFKEYYNNHNCDVRKIKEHMSEEDAYRLEKETISKYRKTSPILCNVDEGGRGLPILKGEKNPMYNVSPKDRMEEETYKQWKYKHTLMVGDKNPNYGKHTLKCKYHMDKEEALRRQSRPGKQNGRATPVKMYDINMNFIKEFDYIGEACQYLIDRNIPRTKKVDIVRERIWKANKENKPCYNFYFKY